MRLYKVLNKWIDLDHVLAVDEPSRGIYYENDFYPGFEITMSFQDRPIQIIQTINGKEFSEWEKTFVVDPDVRSDYLNSYKEGIFKDFKYLELGQIHADFLKAWQNTPEHIVEKTTARGGFVESGAVILYDDNYLFLSNDEGKPFRHQVSCKIIDRVNEATKAIIEVNIAGFKRIEP